MKKAYPVRLLCRAMGVSESAYYAWCSVPLKKICVKTAELEARVNALFRESKSSMGSRKMSQQLKKEGFLVDRYRARRIMKDHHLIVRRKRRFVMTTESRQQNPVADNRLNRQFTPAQPNQVWTTDITY